MCYPLVFDKVIVLPMNEMSKEGQHSRHVRVLDRKTGQELFTTESGGIGGDGGAFLLDGDLLLTTAYRLTAYRVVMSDATASQRIAAVVEQAVAQHAAAAEELEKSPAQGGPRQNGGFMSWSLSGDGTPLFLNRSAAVEDFVASHDPKANAAFALAAAKYLDDKRPRYRAVACELLAHLPLAAIDEGLLSKVAARLDDAGAGLRRSIFRLCRSRVRRIQPVERDVCVSDLANAALESATGFWFGNAQTFDLWWQGNRDTHKHLWYWASRWQTRGRTHSSYHGSGLWATQNFRNPPQESVETDLPTLLADLGPQAR